MIQYFEDRNIFESTADALVNPVNTRGFMGKGLALEFSKRFPECVGPYKKACEEGNLVIGKLVLVKGVKPLVMGSRGPAIILFPTKDHWRGKSRLEWIDAGLQDLKTRFRRWKLESVGMPPIGCGLGGLEWDKVRSLIERQFANESLRIEVCLRNHPAPASLSNRI